MIRVVKNVNYITFILVCIILSSHSVNACCLTFFYTNKSEAFELRNRQPSRPLEGLTNFLSKYDFQSWKNKASENKNFLCPETGHTSFFPGNSAGIHLLHLFTSIYKMKMVFLI